MILKSKELRAIILPAGIGTQPRIILPGINTIPDAEWAQLRPHLADRIGQTLEEMFGKSTAIPATKDKDGKETKPASIKVSGQEPWEVESLQECSKLIEELNRVDLVDAWIAKESRSDIRAQLLNRKDFLANYGKETK